MQLPARGSQFAFKCCYCILYNNIIIYLQVHCAYIVTPDGPKNIAKEIKVNDFISNTFYRMVSINNNTMYYVIGIDYILRTGISIHFQQTNYTLY